MSNHNNRTREAYSHSNGIGEVYKHSNTVGEVSSTDCRREDISSYNDKIGSYLGKMINGEMSGHNDKTGELSSYTN